MIEALSEICDTFRLSTMLRFRDGAPTLSGFSIVVRAVLPFEGTWKRFPCVVRCPVFSRTIIATNLRGFSRGTVKPNRYKDIETKENLSMPQALYWVQCGGCGGDSMSWLNLEAPDLLELLELVGIDLLYHPSLSNLSASRHQQLLDNLLTGAQALDILCVEGSIIRGPEGTGMFDTIGRRPKKDLVAELSRRAGVVLAVGTCASFGGVAVHGEVGATGLQFHNWNRGGFLGADFVSRTGQPVINLAGCPCHCTVLAGTLDALGSGLELELNEYQMPLEWYNLLIHQGCTRNEYHEYRVEEKHFGEKGCLFFHMGCHGPLAHGPCNKLLWNRRSSKTRVGVPCFGCTRPDFPTQHPFFYTRNIEGIPLELPDGVDRAHYLAYKGMAAAAAPERLRRRKTWV